MLHHQFTPALNLRNSTPAVELGNHRTVCYDFTLKPETIPLSICYSYPFLYLSQHIWSSLPKISEKKSSAPKAGHFYEGLWTSYQPNNAKMPFYLFYAKFNIRYEVKTMTWAMVIKNFIVPCCSVVGHCGQRLQHHCCWAPCRPSAHYQQLCTRVLVRHHHTCTT